MERGPLVRKSSNRSDDEWDNPYKYHSFAKIAERFGFGVNTITAFVALGAPVVARKINCDSLKKWLEENGEKVGKIRDN